MRRPPLLNLLLLLLLLLLFFLLLFLLLLLLLFLFLLLLLRPFRALGTTENMRRYRWQCFESPALSSLEYNVLFLPLS